MSAIDFNELDFVDANQEPVPYDGSPLTWRISAYAIVVKDSQLLIIKHAQEKLQDIPGGGIEFGETIEQALTREAQEEAGATIRIGKLLHAEVDWFYHQKTKFHQTVQLFYEAELTQDLAQPSESQIEWVGFVSITEVGAKYRLPDIVEKVVHDHSI